MAEYTIPANSLKVGQCVTIPPVQDAVLTIQVRLTRHEGDFPFIGLQEITEAYLDYIDGETVVLTDLLVPYHVELTEEPVTARWEDPA